jgi:hypothetical protein
MTDQDFNAASKLIVKALNSHGVESAVIERDKINARLAPSERIDFQGPADGYTMLCTLRDKQTGKVLKEQIIGRVPSIRSNF